MTEEKKDDRAEQQARSGVEYIAAMMRRLNHAQSECEGYDDKDEQDSWCDLDARTIIEGVGEYYNEGEKVTPEQRADYHDEEKARQAIEESNYGIQVRGQWSTPGDTDTLADPIEYDITISGGGPATRIYGELGQGNVPENANMQYQDWFTPWETLWIEDDEQRGLLLEYAQQFYFGD